LANPSIGIDLACTAHAAANFTTSAGGCSYLVDLKPCIPNAVAPLSSQRRPFSFPALPPQPDPSPAARRHLHWRPLPSCGTAFVLLIIGPVMNTQPITGKPPIVSTTADRFGTFVAEAAQRFDIPATWIRVVMRAESFGEVHAISSKGAMGLMQIMPETWAHLRARYGLGADPYDPHDSILAGVAYLRALHNRYGSPGFLAAYNAEPTRYEGHLTTGRLFRRRHAPTSPMSFRWSASARSVTQRMSVLCLARGPRLTCFPCGQTTKRSHRNRLPMRQSAGRRPSQHQRIGRIFPYVRANCSCPYRRGHRSHDLA
jgi:Transglycosylase SLT domain